MPSVDQRWERAEESKVRAVMRTHADLQIHRGLFLSGGFHAGSFRMTPWHVLHCTRGPISVFVSKKH